MTPRAVLFDLDDTLAYRAAGLAAYARLFAADFADALASGDVEVVHAALVEADDFGSMRQAGRLCAAGIWRAAPTSQVLFDHWAARFGEAATPAPGLWTVLDALAGRGVKLGLITNGGVAMQRSKIAALGLAQVMSAMLISDELGFRKPDPAIFRHALDRLDCAPHEAWFVGDHPEQDVEGAARAGLRAFWLVQPGRRPPSPPAEHLADLEALLGFL